MLLKLSPGSNQFSYSDYNFLVQEQEDNVSLSNESIDEDFPCYENFTVYHPIFEAAQFWIEGTAKFVYLSNVLSLIL